MRAARPRWRLARGEKRAGEPVVGVDPDASTPLRRKTDDGRGCPTKSYRLCTPIPDPEPTSLVPQSSSNAPNTGFILLLYANRRTMNGNEISRLWPFFEGLIATTENTKSAEIKYFHFLRILDF